MNPFLEQIQCDDADWQDYAGWLDLLASLERTEQVLMEGEIDALNVKLCEYAHEDWHAIC